MGESEESTGDLQPSHHQERGRDLDDALVLANELNRGVDVPEVLGFEMHCCALKANLWWRSGRRRAREFSDVFPVADGRFALIAARVCDHVDGAGASHTLRAYLRAALRKTSSLGDALSEVLALVSEDHQWNLMATLAVCILDPGECRFEFASFGGADVYLVRAADASFHRLGSEALPPIIGNDDPQPRVIKTGRTIINKGDMCLVLSQSISEWMVGQQASLCNCLQAVSGPRERRFRALIGFLADLERTSGSEEKACVAIHCQMGGSAQAATGGKDGGTSDTMERRSQWLPDGWPENGLLAVLRGSAGPICGLDFGPDGQCMVTSSEDGLRLWDTTAGIQHWWEPDETGSPVVFSSDGQWIVSAGMERRKDIRIREAETGRMARAFRGHDEFVNCLAISPNKRWIVSGSGFTSEYGLVGDGEKRLRMWDTSTGKYAHYPSWNMMSAVYAVAFSPDGHRIAVGASDGIVHLLDGQLREEVLTLRGHQGDITNVAFSQDGRRIASSSGAVNPHLSGRRVDNTVRIWDAESGEQLAELCGHENTVSSLALSPTDGEILSGSWDNTVRLWDVESGQLMSRHGEPVGQDDFVNTQILADLTFSPDGTVAAIPASGPKGHVVLLWDMEAIRNSDC